MHTLIASHQAEIVDLCRRFCVERLYLFGSANGESFDPARSDVDFLVDFAPATPREHATRYFGLLQALERLLGRHVDLVELKAIRNPYFREEVEATRSLVFAA